MIGSDFFFREGPAIGMLFEARNGIGLNSDITRQRDATLKREAGCTVVEVEIAGHKVSFLSTPDNRVRSFYAIDGDFFLVTNSRRLVERFFEAGARKRRLGRHRRVSLCSIADADHPRFDGVRLSIGQVFPEPFQPTLSGRNGSPSAVGRRNRHGIGGASFAQEGRGECQIDRSADQIAVSTRWIRPAADGSRFELNDSGELVDSLRGGRGSFIPVLDVPLTQITATELPNYQRLPPGCNRNGAKSIRSWPASGRAEPPKGTWRRTHGDGRATDAADREQLRDDRPGFGPINKQRMAPVPGDMVAGDAILSGNLLASKGLAQPQGSYRLFGALRDAAPEGLGSMMPPQNSTTSAAPTIGRGTLLQAGSALLSGAGGGPGLSLFSFLPPFYFGAYPTPALFGWLGVDIVPPDASGFSRTISGLWERKNGKFTVAAPQRETLEAVTPQLRLIDAARPAQGWLRCGDISHSKLVGFINGIFYRLSKNAAVGNVRFLQELTTQLHVPPDEALKTAELLTDAKLICPLGGTYQLSQNTASAPTWISTALPPDRMRLIDGLMEPRRRVLPRHC